MKKVAAVLAVLAVLGVASYAMAQDANARPPMDPNMRPLRGQVVSVAADGNVVVKTMGRNAAEVTVATDAKTVVTIDGADKKVADLTKDLYVTITPAKGVAEKIVATKEAPPRGGRRGAAPAAP